MLAALTCLLFLCDDPAQGWVLVWALGSNLPDNDLNFYGPRNQTEFQGNSRLMDPQVIICPNASIAGALPF
jgi:hypothetical protein